MIVQQQSVLAFILAYSYMPIRLLHYLQ